MSELTPERISDAAEVLRLLDTGRRPGQKEYAWMPSQLEKRAKDLERQIAEEKAKWDRRIEELADELIEMTYGWDPLPSVSHMRSMKGLAVQLLDRYPALADGPAE
jgi:hypothetical protein